MKIMVFDISEDNKKYALEVAEAANVHLNFEVCDILELNIEKYGNYGCSSNFFKVKPQFITELTISLIVYFL